jgi:short-subunit dehydrogenase
MAQQPTQKPASAGTALVTGASTGIGAVYADRLARRGYDLILVARDLQRLDTLAARLRSETGVQVETLKADLNDKADLLKVEQRLRRDESIAMLVNNAGMSVSGPLIGADPDRLEAMITLNTLAVTRLAIAAATAFATRNRGTLINMASVLALAPELFNSVYSGTKAHVLNLSLGLQQELAKTAVRVQAVLPGATRTEIWDRSGGSVDQLPKEMLMEVDEMVDASLAGLDLGEAVTIPSLPDIGVYEAMTAARLKLAPNLSRNVAAARYKQK